MRLLTILTTLFVLNGFIGILC